MQALATQLLVYADKWAAEVLERELTKNERLIVSNAALGEPTKLPGNPDPRKDPIEANGWTKDHIINPRLIRWLLEDKHKLVNHYGVEIHYARFEKQLDLKLLRTNRDLWFEHGRFEKGMNINGAHIQGLRLQKCAVFETINAVRCTFQGQLCLNGTLLNPAEGHALGLQSSTIKGGAFFQSEGDHRFESTGTIHAPGANISGQIDFSGACLIPPKDNHALNLQNATIEGNAFFPPMGGHRFESTGTIHASGSNITGQLNFSGAHLEPKSGHALSLQNATIKAGAIFDPRDGHSFESTGTIHAAGAKIIGVLDFSGARLTPPKGNNALNLQHATIDGSAMFRPEIVRERVTRFRSTGPLYCHSAHIKGLLLLESARLAVLGEVALNLNQAVVEGDANLGRLLEHLPPVKIQGSFEATRAHFKGDLNMHGIHVSCPEAKVTNAEEGGPTAAINLFSAKIDGAFRLTPSPNDDATADPPVIIGPIDLRSAIVGRLADFTAKHPPIKAETLEEISDFTGPLWRLDGLTYKQLGHNVIFSAESRIVWLDHDMASRPDDQKYQPQPFEQLAKVLREEGHESAARKIAFQKQNHQRDLAEVHLFSLNWLSHFWHIILWATVGYGYKVHRSLVALIVLLIFGWFVFSKAESRQVVAPTTARLWSFQADSSGATSAPAVSAGFEPFDLATLPDEHYQFDAFLYSLDSLIPLFDIGQERAWRIKTNTMTGKRIRFYEIVHISAGWFFTTLLVVGLTGTLKKD